MSFTIGAILLKSWRIPYVIYYTSITLNDAQLNYSTTEKEMLVVSFVLEIFLSYLVGCKIIVLIGYATPKYLIIEKNANVRLISLGVTFAGIRPWV